MSGIEGGGPPRPAQPATSPPQSPTQNPAPAPPPPQQGQAAQAAQAAEAAQAARAAHAERTDARAAQTTAQNLPGQAPPTQPPPTQAAVRAEGLAQLIAQGVSQGNVVGQDGSGQPVVRTQAGHLLLEGARVGAGGLALGQEVTLRLPPVPAGPPGTLTLTLIAGPGGPAGLPGMAPVPVRPALLSMQALLQLGILPAPAGATPAEPSGTHRLAAILLSGAAGGPGAGGPGAGGTATSPGTGGATAWLAGQGFNAGVRIAPAGMAAAGGGAGAVPAAATGADPGAVLAGRVLGPGPSGGTLVQTAAGTFLLQTGQAWPTGLALTMTLEPTGMAMPPGGGHALRGWPALEAAMSQLAAQHPGMAATLRSQAFPAGNSAFTTAFLAFLAAIRGGGLQAWLGGEAARALERGAMGARLAEDVGLFGRLWDERLDGDWRFLPLPYADGERLRQILVYMRDRRGRGDGSDPGTRFVFALELAATGTLQIDGLVRVKRLDLALRTALPVPPAWRSDIRTIFDDALAITGMKGQISFQAGRGALLELPQHALPGPAMTA